MTGTRQGTFGDPSRILADGGEVQLSLPEATMFIVASSGALWALLFGAMSWILG